MCVCLSVCLSVCLPVCLSVCLSVTTLAATSFVFTLKSRYVGVCYRLFLDFKTRGFSKKPSIRKLWREKANMQMSSYKSVQPVHRGRFSSLLGRVMLMFPIVDRRYGSTLLALYGSGSVQRSIGLPPYKYGIIGASVSEPTLVVRKRDLRSRVIPQSSFYASFLISTHAQQRPGRRV